MKHFNLIISFIMACGLILSIYLHKVDLVYVGVDSMITSNGTLAEISIQIVTVLRPTS